MMPRTICNTLAALAAGLGLAGAGITLAGSNSPADTIEARQHGLKALGNASKLIRDELRTSTPDAGKIKAAAEDVKKAAASIGGWFPQGTGPEAGVKTAAKPEIWSDAASFAAARDRFVSEAGKFVQVAAGSDLAAQNEGFRALGQTCKGCHDKFRVRQD